MITLYTFGNGFGLPDPSPFVMKTMLLLKMAGLDFQENRHGFRQAPNGKLPYINDDGEVIADSTFIRFHIEKKYGFDFDAHLNAEQKAAGWAFEKMCEDHLYWAMVDMRWLDADNFNKGPATFFAGVPQPIRLIVTQWVRRKVRKNLFAHGLGRLSKQQIVELAERDIAAISTWLGGKPYLFGDAPCAADASVFGMVSGLLSPLFDSPIRVAAESHPNLRGYCDRILGRYFQAK
jgi:glutathione S-transferase